MVSGIVCYTLPSILAGGHAMVSLITGHTLLVSTMLLLLICKFLFSAFCFGSGAPGGIFFPMLILGSYIGAIYGTIMIQASGIPSYYLVNLSQFPWQDSYGDRTRTDHWYLVDC